MNDQVTDVQVEQVAETQPVVATQEASAPEQNAETPSQETEGGEEKPTQEEEKTFTQKELDEIIQKRIRKAEAVAERRALKTYAEKLEAMSQKPNEQTQKAKVPDGKPTIAQFGEDVEAYVEAVADWKIKQREDMAYRQQEEYHQTMLQNKAEKLYSEAEKVPGFDVEMFESSLTPAIASVIINSDVAPKLMAYIASHPEEIERIVKFSPARQAAEIGKLEVKLSETKTVTASRAPSPMKPVGSKGGQVHKPVAEMSLSELRKFEETRGSKFI